MKPHLEVAIGVEQKIRWLEISVKNVSSVESFEASQCLQSRNSERVRLSDDG